MVFITVLELMEGSDKLGEIIIVVVSVLPLTRTPWVTSEHDLCLRLILCQSWLCNSEVLN